MIIDNHEFKELDNGVLQALQPFFIDIDGWSYDKEHIGYQAIINGFDSDKKARILYLSISGRSSMNLIHLYNDLKKSGQDVGYIEGIPEKDAMGELYA